MRDGKTKSSTGWLAFLCPSCRARLRIKEAYATLRGQCPECGQRIEPRREPASYSLPTSSAEEPLGLVPVEDEWPEPAQVDNKEEGSSYLPTAGPVDWPEPPLPEALPGETFTLAADDLPTPARRVVEPVAKPYAVAPSDPQAPPPVETPLVDPERLKELLPEPPPKPPAHPLWEGIYTFPFRQENLGVWFFLTFNFTLLAVAIAAIGWLIAAGGVYLIGILLLIPLIGFIGFWGGSYAANCFLATVEETASGNHRVAWPQGASVVDGLGRFLYLVWIGACGFIPSGLLGLANGGVSWPATGPGPGGSRGGPGPATGGLWWVWLVVPWVVCFPVLLLSSLTAGLWWKLLDGQVVRALLTRPLALGLMVLPGVILMAPCFWLAHEIVARDNFPLALAAGLTGSTVLLVYGRLLGRVGWMLMEGAARKKPGQKKRRPTGAEPSQPAWGEAADPI